MVELGDKSLLQPNAAFINGEWVTGNATFEVLGPATWQAVARVPDLGKVDMVRAVDGATQAAAELRTVTGKRRDELLRECYDIVKAAQGDLATVITAENGKTIAEARREVTYASDFIDWFAGEAPRIDGS